MFCGFRHIQFCNLFNQLSGLYFPYKSLNQSLHKLFSSTFFDEFELIEQPFKNFFQQSESASYVFSDCDRAECFDNWERDYGILNGQLFLMSMGGTSIFIYDEGWTQIFTTGVPVHETAFPLDPCSDMPDRKFVTVQGLDNDGWECKRQYRENNNGKKQNGFNSVSLY